MVKKMIALRVDKEWLALVDAWIAEQIHETTRTALICVSVLQKILKTEEPALAMLKLKPMRKEVQRSVAAKAGKGKAY